MRKLFLGTDLVTGASSTPPLAIAPTQWHPMQRKALP